LRKKESVAQSDANSFLGQLDELIFVVSVPTIRADADSFAASPIEIIRLSSVGLSFFGSVVAVS
jgi:hypothetical protein